MAYDPSNAAIVKALPGQTLVFVPGKGYVAKGTPTKAKATYKPPASIPVGTRPATGAAAPTLPGPDPYAALAPDVLDQRATALANSQLLPQQQEIQRQQALARAAAVADEGAITGFSTAASGILKDIPGQVGKGYRDAAATQGAIGTGVGGAVGADLADKTAAGLAFEASQGQQGGSTLDAAGAGDTVGYLGGVLPGDTLAQQGAAAQGEAAQAIQIPLDAGKQQLDARMAQARVENDGYAQQLISLAATFPGLKAQALQQLNQYELDKANYREQKRVSDANIADQSATRAERERVDAEQKRVDDSNIKGNAEAIKVSEANITAQRADTARQDRAEIAQEKAAGLKATAAADLMNYKWASLSFQNAKEAERAKAATRKGKTIDVQASKLLGHLVFKDGSEDSSIKVRQSTAATPQAKAQVNRAKATSAARVNAFKYATKIMGTPTAVDKKTIAAIRATGGNAGKYIADPKYASIPQGKPGAVYKPAYVGAPATTNRPGRALHAGSGASDYADAQTKVWAEIDGDGLMSRFGYSRQQVLAIVNSALARAGWRK